MFAKRLAVLLLSASTATAAAVDNALISRRQTTGSPLATCPGYEASNVQTTDSGVTADLTLAGPACNTYGYDLPNLRLIVEYQNQARLHVKIEDAAQRVYQVPNFIVPRPGNEGGSASGSDLSFSMVNSPFSFAITRQSTGETLFNTSGSTIIFQSQYLRLRTQLPQSPHLYGLGEHTDPFMLNTTDYVRTLWNRDAYGMPPGTNLYGSHPIYFDHRGSAGTHGVFFLNSNGMDIAINNTAETGQYLEYNTLGGVFDFYFLSGPGPRDVSRQYAQVVGLPAMQPYWGLGFHQCKYGYRDVFEVAEVVANYSQANIPLETMWTDIDYMEGRKVFTLDPLRYPLELVQQLVDTLHARQQHYIVMVDPAVAYDDYPSFNRGVQQDAFIRSSNGSIYVGVVWPGPTAFPDWFHPQTQDYWTNEFLIFFNEETGVDIDALWIDMNEPANPFCPWPCPDPFGWAARNGFPPRPPPVRPASPRPIPGFPAAFQPQCLAQVSFNVNASTYFGENIVILGDALAMGDNDIDSAAALSPNNYPIWSAVLQLPTNSTISYQYVRTQSDGSFIYENITRTVVTGTCDGSVQSVNDIITTAQGIPPSRMVKREAEGQTLWLSERQAAGSMVGLPDRNLLFPPYMIQHTSPNLSASSIDTDLPHYGGYVEYDVHNIYGAMMSTASRLAMLARRPNQRPMVITRSTFAGSGRDAGKWTGDNVSDWFHYRISIANILEFAALFQIPMVGADVCGFAGVTTERLCARWAMLGAFYPFYRNHHGDNPAYQEFYRWPLVAEAARNAMDARYRLMDYAYTALWDQTQTGSPMLNPMYFNYPNDANTFPISLQFFFGDSILVSPVTEENSTSVSIYLPDDQFYDFFTFQPVRGQGAMVTLTDVPYTAIPLHIRGGSIIPLRVASANTTTELRKQNFNIVVAPGLDGNAQGSLYLDDGDSLVQPSTSNINFAYVNGTFSMSGQFGYDAGVVVETITLLGQSGRATQDEDNELATAYAATSQTLTFAVNTPLTGGFNINI